MNPVREKTEYFFLRGLICLLKILPECLITGILRLFSSLFFLLGIRRRKMTLANLSLALPDLTPKQRAQLAWKTFDHFGRFMAESILILSGKLTQKKLIQRVDESEIQKLLEIEQNTEKGILFITGHLGNFELLAHYTGTQLKRPSVVVARKGTNQLIDDRIITPLRKSFGNDVIHKRRALPKIARALRDGKHTGLLIDIKSNSRQGVPVTFFDQKIHALKSSAYLQIKLGVPVVPTTLIRVASKRYKLIVSDPIEWADNGQPESEQISELTQIHQTAIEKLIRQYPDQWLWMHNRFKLMDARTHRRQERKATRLATKEAS